MKNFIAILTTFCLSVGSSAHAGCGIKNPKHLPVARAVACFEPDMDNAIEAYERFGLNSSELEKDYMQELVRQSGCVVLNENIFGAFDMRLYSHGRRASPSGWRYLSFVLMHDKYGDTGLFIDDRYIEGECTKPDAPVTVKGVPKQSY